MLRPPRMSGTPGGGLRAVLRLRVGRRAQLLLSGVYGISPEKMLEAADAMRRALADLGIHGLILEIVGEDSAGRQA